MRRGANEPCPLLDANLPLRQEPSTLDSVRVRDGDDSGARLQRGHDLPPGSREVEVESPCQRVDATEHSLPLQRPKKLQGRIQRIQPRVIDVRINEADERGGSLL